MNKAIQKWVFMIIREHQAKREPGKPAFNDLEVAQQREVFLDNIDLEILATFLAPFKRVIDVCIANDRQLEGQND